MRFAYRPAPLTAEVLLASEAWRTLASLLAEFAAESRTHGAVPVLAYLPTKFEIYAALATPASGSEFLAQRDALLPFAGSQADALRTLAARAGVALVDLGPGFRARATSGELLYYPFVSHWNAAGRQAAAEEIARALAAIPAPTAGQAPRSR